MRIESSRARLAALALSALLGSCGGGGGGGGGDGGGDNDGGGAGSGPAHFTADKSAISFEFMEGNGTPAQEVTVTATGELPSTLFIGAVVESSTGGIDPAIEVFISGTTAVFRIHPPQGLAEGTYTGRIRLMGCADANCSRQVGNSPLYVSYSTAVRPRLRTSPGAVTMNAVSGSSATAEVTVTIPWQQTTQTAEVSFGSEWLTVTSSSPSALHLSARSLPSGTHTGSIRISSGPYQLTLPVTYVVTPPPGGEFDLRAGPASLTFAATENTVAAPQTITVTGPTWAPNVAVRAVPGYTYNPYNLSQGWLTAEPVLGGYRITADARNLRADSYGGQIYIDDDDPQTTSTPVIIPVAFTVGAGIVRPADIDIAIDSNVTATSPIVTGSMPINLSGGPQIQWTATSSQPNWVEITRAAGDTGTSLTYKVHLENLNLDSTYQGVDIVYIVVEPSVATMQRAVVEVRLKRRLAHVDSIWPNRRIYGRATRHIVRGGNFIAGRDWSQHLLFGGVASAASVTRVNDSELVVELAANQPNANITARNELGLGTQSAVVQLTQRYDVGYESLPTNYPVSRMYVDQFGLGAALVDENNGLGLLHIINATTVTGNWVGGQPQVIAGLEDVIFGQDTRYILSADGVFTGTYNAGFGWKPSEGLHFPPTGGAGAVTNDRKLWLGVGDAAHPRLAYVQMYDYYSSPNGPPTIIDSPLLDLRDGPSFAASRNGERLFISQSSSSGPQLLSLNAADGQLFALPNQGGLNSLSAVSMSDDAGRLVAQDFLVRDAQFSVIGHLNVTQHNFMSVAVNVTSDGKRAYVLAYERGELTAPTPQFTPRVYVFDLSSGMGAGQQMPLIGYFTLAHYPTCLRTANCSLRPQSVLAEAQNTLFYAGDQRFIVAPIPPESSLQSRLPPGGVQKQNAPVIKRMK